MLTHEEMNCDAKALVFNQLLPTHALRSGSILTLPVETMVINEIVMVAMFRRLTLFVAMINEILGVTA